MEWLGFAMRRCYIKFLDKFRIVCYRKIAKEVDVHE